MMANPLARRDHDQPAVRNSEEFLRAWCWEKNQQAASYNFAHWLHVRKDKDTGALSCKARTGADALDVIKVMSGWYPDFMNWDHERLDSEFRILRHIARMGMPQEEFERLLPGIANPMSGGHHPSYKPRISGKAVLALPTAPEN